tara:strand:- start:1928 stop:2359 length:432 start_codon:yes stop_codon:yes gene_type:complete
MKESQNTIDLFQIELANFSKTIEKGKLSISGIIDSIDEINMINQNSKQVGTENNKPQCSKQQKIVQICNKTDIITIVKLNVDLQHGIELLKKTYDNLDKSALNKLKFITESFNIIINTGILQSDIITMFANILTKICYSSKCI